MSYEASAIIEAAMALVGGEDGGGQENSWGTDNSEPEYDDDVVILTDANYQNIVPVSDETWMIMFYAPWCQFC